MDLTSFLSFSRHGAEQARTAAGVALCTGTARRPRRVAEAPILHETDHGVEGGGGRGG